MLSILKCTLAFKVFCFALILLWLLKTKPKICIRPSLHRFKIISSIVYQIHTVAWIFLCFLLFVCVCMCMVMVKENNLQNQKYYTKRGKKVLSYVMCMRRSHLSRHLLHKEISLSKKSCVYDIASMGFFEGFQSSLFIAVIKHSKLADHILSLKDLKAGTWRQKLK